MTVKNEVSPLAGLWAKLVGRPEDFSMENRAFNFVSVISFLLLGVFLLTDIYISQIPMCFLSAVLMAIQIVIYYFSRFQKKHSVGIIIYALCSYVALCINYYYNSGINGPSLLMFLITFLLLIAISKPRLYPLWITLHLAVVGFLMGSEYLHPAWAADTYLKKSDRMMDLAVDYTAAIIFIFSITTYLRKYFYNQKKLATERAMAIEEQSQHILEQNRQLEKVNEEKNKLFSIISHDLRSPIDSIRGYLELLAEDLLTKEEEKAIQEELLTQTKYTSELLLNILYWSKTQMQGVTVHLKPLNLKTIIDKSANLKIALGAKKGVKLTYSIPQVAEVVADQDMLVIVLRNLINNAIKFTPKGGEIFITVSANEAEETLISVKDTGIGIPEDRQDEIFSFKTQSTFGTNNEKGIGMGLMLCKEFVEYQHGKIWFESKQDEGTTFFVTLPKPKL